MRCALFVFLLCLHLFDAEETKPANETVHEFTADISKMMKIIINSLYSNKDIFLRELISNCADAMNKVRVQANVNASILGEGDHARLDIRIIPDEEEQTITIIDRGIGMNESELINDLSTIAHSGTQHFLEGVGHNESEVDLIGQFGVGFYSSFLVADKVVVTSKRFDDKQYIWTSNNAQSFDIVEDKTGESLFRGTKVVLHLRDPTYANATLIKELALHYSEFVDFPIYVRMESGQAGNTKDIENDDDEEDKDNANSLPPLASFILNGHHYDYVHINTRRAIWQRDPSKISDKEYIEFFRTLTRDYNETPLLWEHYNCEGDVSFKSILYIPDNVPDVEMTANRKYQSLKLYVHRVLITEEFDDFIPRYLSWIRGVIDSDDLQLNVSREMLQESKHLRAIGRKIVKKILQILLDMAQKNEKEGDPLYNTFYPKYKRYIKMGIMDDSTSKRKLARLLRFNSTRCPTQGTSLDEYLENMRPDQTDFFYIAGDPAVQNITESPFLIPYKKKGIEVLYFSEPIDELVVRDLKEYDHKIFISITQAPNKDLTDQSEFEKEKLKQWRKRYKPLVTFFQEALGDRVARCEVSSRLAADDTTPCVLSNIEGTASANLERYSHQQHRLDPRYEIRESKKVLEINPINNLIKRMSVAIEQVEADTLEGPDEDDDKELSEERLKNSKLRLETIALLLYDTAVFESGFVVGDTNEYAERVFDVLTRMTGLPAAPVLEDEDIVNQVLREEEEEDMKRESEEAEKKKKEEEKKKKELDRKKKNDDEERKESEAEKTEEKKEEKKEVKTEKKVEPKKVVKKEEDDDDEDEDDEEVV